MKGRQSKESYETAAHRQVDQYPDRMLLKIIPMTEAGAREYLGAANEYDASQRVIEHFAACVRDLK